MEPLCLCCKNPVPEQDARLFQKVFVCPKCHDEAKKYTEQVRRDLHELSLSIDSAVQQGLRLGEFDLTNYFTHYNRYDRVESLVRWSQKVKEERCQTISVTPPTSLPTLSSGEDSKPHVATLSALGRSSSPSSMG